MLDPKLIFAKLLIEEDLDFPTEYLNSVTLDQGFSNQVDRGTLETTEMKKVIVGCEPTNCYWLAFQKFLQDHGTQLVTVNPFTVNRSMKLDDDGPEKSDLKDPQIDCLVCKGWKIFNFLSSKRSMRSSEKLQSAEIRP